MFIQFITNLNYDSIYPISNRRSCLGSGSCFGLLCQTKKKKKASWYSRMLKTERLLLRRENILDQKLSEFEKSQKEFQNKVEKLKEIKENLESLRQEATKKLEKVSSLSKVEAKKELLQNLEKEYEQELSEKMRKLEHGGWEKYEAKAKEILTTAIQKCGLSQAQNVALARHRRLRPLL